MRLEVIILAAGAGKRMHSQRPKVLHPVAGKPMLQHVLDTAQALQPSAVHIVIGSGAEQVRSALPHAQVNWIEQAQQLGTGHAVLQALPFVAANAMVLVLYGDVPLVQASSLQQLLTQAAQGPALLTAHVDNPSGYGRILRDVQGEMCGVVEHSDASAEQRQIAEINTGILAASAELLNNYLPRVGSNNAQGEFYLPQVLSLAATDGLRICSACVEDELDILGVNDRAQLQRVERACQYRLAQQLLHSGVGLADAARLDVRGRLRCGRDVFIDLNVLFEGEVTLGDAVTIGANCVLIDCEIADGVVIHPFSHLQGVVVGAGCEVGPFARLRPETCLEAGAKIGNFVEVKKSRIGAGSKVNHLSYVGDCDMGSGVNIGAGTITCNYDGANKHRTHIGDGVFVGSNSTLVAPLELAPGGFVGAGSTITKPVAADQLAISRARQRNLDGWQRPTKKEA